MRCRCLFMVFLLALAAPLCASEHEDGENAPGEMVRHMRDAIRINKARLPMYSAASNRDSERVSKALIRFEQVAIPGAWTIDKLAAPFQKKGIPIAQEEFMSMELIPDYVDEHPDEAEPFHTFKPVDGWAMSLRLRAEYKKDGFAGVSRQAFMELAQLESKTYHHLIRHMLDSIRRVCVLAPKHEKLAKAKGAGSTKRISWMMLESHLVTLVESARIDKLAAPLQSRRIPIIRNDIPHIPLYSEFYDGPK